jgi:Zn-dependent protease with chaperone function
MALGGLENQARKLGWLATVPTESTWLVLPSLALFAGYLFLVFGFLSRKCEREADLYGVRAVAMGRVDGHSQAAGVYAMTRALSKVAVLNGMDDFSQRHASWLARLWALLLAWQHGSIGDRIEFLNRTLEEPGLERHAQRRIAIFRWLMMLGLVLALIALGSGIGWDKLLAML